LLRIRLRRVGKKKRPVYRVVVADSRAPQRGAFIETIGLYDPLTEPATVNIDQEKAQKWLQQGARPSETVDKLLARQGLLPAKAPEVLEATEAPETSEAAEPSAPAE
jgi:small subunit ribosomal protein S16